MISLKLAWNWFRVGIRHSPDELVFLYVTEFQVRCWEILAGSSQAKASISHDQPVCFYSM